MVEWRQSGGRVEAEKFLGTDLSGHNYYMGTDYFVYQEGPDGKCCGWICSGPAWERTMHKIVEGNT